MFLVAASGNAMNMYLERYTDFLMPRTAKRPLPDCRLTSLDVVTFAAICLGSGLSYLLTTLNWQTTICAVLTWVLYVFVYTPMKSRTWLNTEVGAVAGALPVIAGALATTESPGWDAWGLFLVLLFWQFPHFMAIAWLYRDQYRDGGLQMLTVVDPTGARAGRKAVVMSVATWGVSLLPIVRMESTGGAILFGVLASIAAVFYLIASMQFRSSPDESSARRLLRVSVIYLPLYLLLIVVFSQF
jgi:protoheme IX farnesyltransferase